MGVNSAVLYFNDGTNGINRVMRHLKVGETESTGSLRKDKLRINNMKRKSLNVTKIWRKKLRAIKKSWTDKENQNEAKNAYCSGDI